MNKDSARELEKDVRDIKRGALVSFGGYLIKAAHPVLLVLVIRAYGATAFGVFTAAQALLLFLIRFCLVGLDKSLLWWVPQQKQGELKKGCLSVFILASTIASITTASILMFGAPLLANVGDVPEATVPIRIMSIALIPMVMTELLLHMTVGIRRMEPTVVARETVLPISLVSLALALYPLDLGLNGIAIAHVGSHLITLLVSVYFFRRYFKNERDSSDGVFPPKKLFQYGIPLWFAEMANSFMQRMDVYIIATIDYKTLGIYGAVVQIANILRSIRRSFDPIVLAIASKVGAHRDTSRMGASLSFATFMVVVTQFPLLLFFIVFAEWILPLYGEGFEQGVLPVIILCAFWVVNSALSLSGIVVQGYGYSRIVLYNTLGNIILLGILLLWLVPEYKLVGAAIAVGSAYTVLSVVQLIEMNYLTGGVRFQLDIVKPLAVASFIGGALLSTLLIPNSDALWIRISFFSVFAAIYLFTMWPAYKKYQTTFAT